MKKLITLMIAVFGTALQAQEIDLQWNDNSTNEDGFIVERSQDGTTYEQVGTTETDIAYFQDTSFPIEVTVFYRVYAFNEFGNSGYSNVVSIFTGPPEAPTELRRGTPNTDATWRPGRGYKTRNKKNPDKPLPRGWKLKGEYKEG